MKIVITGLSNSGKTTLFNALTGQDIPTPPYPATEGEPHMGVVKVPDSRLDRLAEIFKAKKTTYSTVEYVDYIGITKGDIKQNRKVFEAIKDADTIVNVIRAFEEEAVVHPFDIVDPAADASTFETELRFGDLEFVERRIENMELSRVKGKKPDEEEKKVLLKCKESLENDIALRDVRFTEEEIKSMRHMQFLSMKPEVAVVNIGESDINTERASDIVRKVKGLYGESQSVLVYELCAKAEMEIAGLPPEERKAFLDDLGIKSPVRDRLIRICYELLGLISFLTAGEKETRSWAIRKGSDAMTAAGKIHTDIQRGFIRAEVISYEDFMEKAGGSMAAAREKGLLRLEGKTYNVKDGDIMEFRFNV